ncbi:unnamed protein product [Leptidea sinapis]|uniref:Uncharacterized protein n=1 Tax=Leptidea sinapis TaxID=189913 RepID=A0A5E4Q5R4_9NEOP|nr:unnamed protein product [Leptidea sinapis]
MSRSIPRAPMVKLVLRPAERSNRISKYSSGGQTVTHGKVVFQANMSLSMDTTVGDDWYLVQVVRDRDTEPNTETTTMENQRNLKRNSIKVSTSYSRNREATVNRKHVDTVYYPCDLHGHLKEKKLQNYFNLSTFVM